MIKQYTASITANRERGRSMKEEDNKLKVSIYFRGNQGKNNKQNLH